MVNGDELAVAADSTVAALLQQLRIQGRIAVEVNGSIVPRSSFSGQQLHAGDKIEIVHAVGGG